LWLHIQSLDASAPGHHTKNTNKELYMQPQIHTACTRYYNVK